MANSSVTHTYMKFTQHVHAVCEACHCLLVVGDIGQRFCTGLNALGVIVNREISNKNTRKCKGLGTTRTVKRLHLQYGS